MSKVLTLKIILFYDGLGVLLTTSKSPYDFDAQRVENVGDIDPSKIVNQIIIEN